jgi:hypothetical protein
MGRWTDKADEFMRRQAPAETNANCELREFASEPVRTAGEELAHPTDQEIRFEIHEQLSLSRAVWSSICFESAEALAFPTVQLAPSRVGRVGAGDANWRSYLKLAPLTELKHVVAPYLRHQARADQFVGGYEDTDQA